MQSHFFTLIKRRMLTASLALLCVSNASAQIYVADSGNNSTGNSWANAYRDIQVAIIAADATNAEVWVKEGTYFESITIPDGVKIYGGFAGTETLLSQRDIDANPTIINASTVASGSPADHVVVVSGVTNTRVDGFTLTGGVADEFGVSGESRLGGGIQFLNANNTNRVANCTIIDNHAAVDANARGGGIGCLNASPIIEDCVISANTATNGGGGISIENGTLTLTRCVISENDSDKGGGIAGWEPSTLILSQCNIANNNANDDGGGIYAIGALDASRCIVRENEAEKGAGIHGEEGSIVNSLIVDNTAKLEGGGINCNSSGIGLAVTNCTLAGNESVNFGAGHHAGGICISSANPAPVIANCIFANHTFHAIYERSASADATVLNCLFFSNAPADYRDESSTSYTGGNAINTNVAGAQDNIDGDPLFVSLATSDYRISTGSPAIGAALAAGAPIDDYFGVSRPQQGSFDIGFHEFSNTDSDGDGISDAIEGNVDTDNDTVVDRLDTDSDNDTIPDSIEGADDIDNDFIANFRDPDSDGDGILDSVEGSGDPDEDDLPNFIDLDSDNDNLSDEDEDALYSSDPYSADSDEDGRADEWEIRHATNPINANDSKEGNLVWVKKARDERFDSGRAVAALSDSSVLVAGTAGNGQNLAGEIFLAKYNRKGKKQWWKSVPCDSNGAAWGRQIANDVAISEDEKIYVAGVFGYVSIFGEGEPKETTLSAPSSGGNRYSEIFIAKYTGKGNLSWAKQAGGSDAPGDAANGITIMDDDSLIVAGEFSGTATFGADDSKETTLVAEGQTDAFVAKYKPSGKLVWAKRAGGTGPDAAAKVAAYPDGSFVVTGSFKSTATFGPGEPNETELTATGQEDAFIAKYKKNGNLEWVRTVGSTESDYGHSVTLANDGNAVVCGAFWGQATFNAGTASQISITADGFTDMFLAKYGPTGELIWIKHGGYAGNIAHALGVAAANDGGLLVTGWFQSNTSISHYLILGEGEANETKLQFLNDQYYSKIFVAKYNTDGSLHWARSAGGSELEHFAYDVTASPDDAAYVTGHFFGKATFAPDEPNETEVKAKFLNNNDIFIGKYVSED